MRGTSRLKTLDRIAVWLALPLLLVLLVPVAASGQTRGDLDPILEELESYALTVWEPDKIPGFAYAVVRGTETVYARGFGKKSQDPASGPVDEHTLFEIGSCTKAFNAALLGQVVEGSADGHAVPWTDKVHDHLPDFKMHDPWVTKQFLIEDLMAQRSGMPGYAVDAMSELGFGREDIRRAIRFVEPTTSFRSSFAYQNCLHLWASELIEKRTGLVWEEAVRQRILEPLQMTESTFDWDVYYANPNHVMGHMVLDDKSLWTIPSDWPYRDWVTVYAPAGGLKSNITDMAKWVALQLGNGALGEVVINRPETVQAIRTPRICIGADPSFAGVASYANAWVLQSSPVTTWYWHTGGTIGMHAIVSLFPEADLGLVALTNVKGNKLPECLSNKLLELVFGAEPRACPPAGGLMEDVAPRRGARPAPRPDADGAAAIPLNKLAGTYANPAYGKVLIKKEGGGVSMTIGPAKRHATLIALGGNTYGFPFPDWPGAGATLVFKADASGEVTKVTIDLFEDVRGGVFKKSGG